MNQKFSYLLSCLNNNIIKINIYSTYVNYLSRDTSFSPFTEFNIYNISKNDFRNYFLKKVLKKGLLEYLEYFQYSNTVNYVPKSQKSHA